MLDTASEFMPDAPYTVALKNRVLRKPLLENQFSSSSKHKVLVSLMEEKFPDYYHP